MTPFDSLVFVFFRCWPGLGTDFSVEDYNSLPDDEIETALNRHALDWLRTHRDEVRKLAKKRLDEQEKAIKRRRRVYLSRPDGKWGPRLQRSEPRRSVRRLRYSLFCRVGDYAGWVVQKPLNFDKESAEVKSAGPLVAVYHTSDRGFAEEVVRRLNVDWSKYDSGFPRYDYDPTSGAPRGPLFHLETELNPRFGLLPARDTSRERFRLMMLQVANLKKNEPPDVLHPDLHFAVAQRAMKVIGEMEVAWRSQPPSDPAPKSQTPADGAGGADEDEQSTSNTTTAKKTKRSTGRGGAETKLIGALTKHHQYAEGGCMNLGPIGSNILAAKAKVGQGSANRFFNKWFGSAKKAKDGYENYRIACNDKGKLIAILKSMNGDMPRTGEVLFGRKVPDEAENPDHQGGTRRKPRASELHRHDDC